MVNHHRHSTMTQPCHKDTPLNQQCCNSRHKGRRGGWTIREGAEHARCRTQREDKASQQHTTHRHSIGPQGKQQGGRQHADGGHRHSTGSPATQPPFTHHATHHHNGTPPSTMAPPTTTTRGERAEDTPPHEHHTHTHTHTPQHLARNSTRHDSSTDE